MMQNASAKPPAVNSRTTTTLEKRPHSSPHQGTLMRQNESTVGNNKITTSTNNVDSEIIVPSSNNASSSSRGRGLSINIENSNFNNANGSSSNNNGETASEASNNNNNNSDANAASNGTNIASSSKRAEEAEDIDSEMFRYLEKFSIGQNFVSVMNDPRSKNDSWGLFDFWDSSKADAAPAAQPLSSTNSSSNNNKLPVVERKDFDEYINKIKGPLATYTANKILDKGDAASSSSSKQNWREYSMEVLVEKEGVPRVFFRDDFSLDEPEFFSEIFTDNAVTAQLLLQEKLSYYLDKVEVFLLQQVSLRSKEVFRALVQYRDLQIEVKNAMQFIAQMRAHIANFEEESVKKALSVNMLTRRRQNMMKLYKKIKLISTVRQTQATVQLLLSTCDYVSALDLIGTTKRVVSGELAGIQSFKFINQQLSELESFIEKIIASEFVNMAVVSLLQDQSGANNEEDQIQSMREQLTPLVHGLIRVNKLRDGLQMYKEDLAKNTKKTIKEAIKACFAQCAPEVQKIIDDEKSSSALLDNLRGLSAQQFFFMISSVFDTIFTNLKQSLLVNRVISSLIEEYNKTAISFNSSNITALLSADDADDEFDSFELYNDNDNNNNNKQDRSDNNKRTVSPANSRNGLTAEDVASYKQLLNELAAHVCELGQSQCARVFQARAEEHKKLSRKDFIELSNATMQFVKKCESLVNAKLNFSLRSTLTSQTAAFIDAFHTSKKKKIELLINHEDWLPAEIPSEFQGIVTRLASSQHHHHQQQQKQQKQQQEAPALPPATTTTTTTTTNTTTTAGESSSPATINNNNNNNKLLMLDGLGYPVCGSMLMLIQLVEDYASLGLEFNQMALVVFQRMVDTLKFYNNRAKELVLGAQALQSAGLKSITTKHLALLSQCLNFLAAFEPGLRAHWEPLLAEKQRVFLNDLDKFRDDCIEHQKDIHAKVIAIMKERLDHYKGKMLTHSWDERHQAAAAAATDAAAAAEGGGGGGTTTPHMKGLIKETGVLYRVLSQFLHPPTLKSIFARVISMYVLKLKELIEQVQIRSEFGKKSLYDDLAFFKQSIRNFGGGGSGEGTDVTAALDEAYHARFGGSSLSRLSWYQRPTTTSPAVPSSQ